MEKEENNTDSGNFREIIAFLIETLTIYAYGGQKKIREEEHKLYREQYPFEEYYYFKEDFRFKWE